MSKTLDEMQAEVYANNLAHGWFEEDRSVGDDVALLHTEVSEMFEAYRVTGLSDATVELEHTAPNWGKVAKPEGFGSEVADVFIRLLDTCQRRGVDLEFEYQRKMVYNRTRPYKHGKNL